MNTLAFTFLGTASAYPSPQRCASCTALSHDEGIWIFDCGEGAQVQLMKSSLRLGKINKIFITHLHGDHAFGLPGLLCTLGTHGQRERPVEIYGPAGIRHFVCANLGLSRGDFAFDFIVHEMTTIPEQLPENAEIWPLDEPLTAPFHPREKPGKRINPDHDSIWHLFSDSNSKLSVKAVWVKHRIPSFSFVIQEAERPGKLDVNKLKSLGVSPGPLYSKIKSGETIQTQEGVEISPSSVLGPSIAGRLLVVSGDSCDSSQLKKLAHGADVLVHETTLENEMWEQCVQNGHSTPEMTASLALDLEVKMLVCTHVSQRYRQIGADVADGEKTAQILLDQARMIMPSERVMLAEDFDIYTVPRS